MVQISDNMRGAALMAGSMAAFTINDAFMKLVLTDVPLFQALFLRGLGVLAFLVILCRLLGQWRFDFSRADWGLVLLRTVGELVSTFCFLNALRTMPLANLSAILQALPLTVSLAAALIFRETLGWRRLSAICVGFIGVLLIIRPGPEGFSAYALWGVGAVIFVTMRDLSARRLSREVPSVVVALVAAVGVTVFAGVGSVFVEWTAMPARTAWQLAGAMACLVGGYVFSVAAMRSGEISFIAPFRYTSLLVALVLGYLVFDEFPGFWTLIGAGIVVATGLFTLYREARLKRQNPVPMGRLR